MTASVSPFPQVTAPWLILPNGARRVFAGQRQTGWPVSAAPPFRPIAAIGGIALIVSTGRAHYYQDCGDTSCMMFGCRAFKHGYELGWQAGNAAGYTAGFAAGVASSAGAS